jgi:hypothetical protein
MTKNQVTVVTSAIAAISAIVVAAFGWQGAHPSSQSESARDGAPAVDCRRASQPGDEATTITFVNQSQQTVQLFWVDASGVQLPYEVLVPGQQVTNDTTVGHSWCVRERDSGSAVAFAIASADEQAVVIQ